MSKPTKGAIGSAIDRPETKMPSQKLAKALQEAGIPAIAFPAEEKTHRTINSEMGLLGDEPTKAVF